MTTRTRRIGLPHKVAIGSRLLNFSGLSGCEIAELRQLMSAAYDADGWVDAGQLSDAGRARLRELLQTAAAAPMSGDERWQVTKFAREATGDVSIGTPRCEAKTIIRDVDPPARRATTPVNLATEPTPARATARVHFPRFKEGQPDDVLEVEIPPEAYFGNA